MATVAGRSFPFDTSCGVDMLNIEFVHPDHAHGPRAQLPRKKTLKEFLREKKEKAEQAGAVMWTTEEAIERLDAELRRHQWHDPAADAVVVDDLFLASPAGLKLMNPAAAHFTKTSVLVGDENSYSRSRESAADRSAAPEPWPDLPGSFFLSNHAYFTGCSNPERLHEAWHAVSADCDAAVGVDGGNLLIGEGGLEQGLCCFACDEPEPTLTKTSLLACECCSGTGAGTTTPSSAAASTAVSTPEATFVPNGSRRAQMQSAYLTSRQLAALQGDLQAANEDAARRPSSVAEVEDGESISAGVLNMPAHEEPAAAAAASGGDPEESPPSDRATDGGSAASLPSEIDWGLSEAEMRWIRNEHRALGHAASLRNLFHPQAQKYLDFVRSQCPKCRMHDSTSAVRARGSLLQFGTDCNQIWIADTLETRIGRVVFVIDAVSRLRCGAVIDSSRGGTPAAAIRALMGMKLLAGGVCGQLVADQGSEFVNARFRAFLRSQNIAEKFVPFKAPWRLSKIESRNGDVRSVVHKFLAEPYDPLLAVLLWGLEMGETIRESVDAALETAQDGERFPDEMAFRADLLAEILFQLNSLPMLGTTLSPFNVATATFTRGSSNWIDLVEQQLDGGGDLAAVEKWMLYRAYLQQICCKVIVDRDVDKLQQRRELVARSFKRAQVAETLQPQQQVLVRRVDGKFRAYHGGEVVSVGGDSVDVKIDGRVMTYSANDVAVDHPVEDTSGDFALEFFPSAPVAQNLQQRLSRQTWQTRLDRSSGRSTHSNRSFGAGEQGPTCHVCGELFTSRARLLQHYSSKHPTVSVPADFRWSKRRKVVFSEHDLDLPDDAERFTDLVPPAAGRSSSSSSDLRSRGEEQVEEGGVVPDDYWVEYRDTWVRYHPNLRDCKFVPQDDLRAGPDPDTLTNRRKTVFRLRAVDVEDDDREQAVVDDWRTLRARERVDAVRKFFGRTIFYKKSAAEDFGGVFGADDAAGSSSDESSCSASGSSSGNEGAKESTSSSAVDSASAAGSGAAVERSSPGVTVAGSGAKRARISSTPSEPDSGAAPTKPRKILRPAATVGSSSSESNTSSIGSETGSIMDGAPEVLDHFLAWKRRWRTLLRELDCVDIGDAEAERDAGWRAMEAAEMMDGIKRAEQKRKREYEQGEDAGESKLRRLNARPAAAFLSFASPSAAACPDRLKVDTRLSPCESAIVQGQLHPKILRAMRSCATTMELAVESGKTFLVPAVLDAPGDAERAIDFSVLPDITEKLQESTLSQWRGRLMHQDDMVWKWTQLLNGRPVGDQEVNPKNNTDVRFVCTAYEIRRGSMVSPRTPGRCVFLRWGPQTTPEFVDRDDKRPVLRDEYTACIFIETTRDAHDEINNFTAACRSSAIVVSERTAEELGCLSYFYAALRDEVGEIVSNDVFDGGCTAEELRQRGQKAITSRIVITIKCDRTNGCFTKWKVRWVSRGFEDRRFSGDAASSLPSCRAYTLGDTSALWLLQLAQAMREVPGFVDVRTAFLRCMSFTEQYGADAPEIYMAIPEVVRRLRGFSFSEVMRLKRALYGLKDAPRAWLLTFGLILREIGAQPSSADPCCWVYRGTPAELAAVRDGRVDEYVRAKMKVLDGIPAEEVAERVAALDKPLFFDASGAETVDPPEPKAPLPCDVDESSDEEEEGGCNLRSMQSRKLVTELTNLTEPRGRVVGALGVHVDDCMLVGGAIWYLRLKIVFDKYSVDSLALLTPGVRDNFVGREMCSCPEAFEHERRAATLEKAQKRVEDLGFECKEELLLHPAEEVLSAAEAAAAVKRDAGSEDYPKAKPNIFCPLIYLAAKKDFALPVVYYVSQEAYCRGITALEQPEVEDYFLRRRTTTNAYLRSQLRSPFRSRVGGAMWLSKTSAVILQQLSQLASEIVEVEKADTWGEVESFVSRFNNLLLLMQSADYSTRKIYDVGAKCVLSGIADASKDRVGGAVFVHGVKGLQVTVLSCWSKPPRRVYHSSSGIELLAQRILCTELLWSKQLGLDLGLLSLRTPIVQLCDAKNLCGAVRPAERNLQADFWYLTQLRDHRILMLLHIAGLTNATDALTKPPKDCVLVLLHLLSAYGVLDGRILKQLQEFRRRFGEELQPGTAQKKK
eukprot:g16472.t1